MVTMHQHTDNLSSAVCIWSRIKCLLYGWRDGVCWIGTQETIGKGSETAIWNLASDFGNFFGRIFFYCDHEASSRSASIVPGKHHAFPREAMNANQRMQIRGFFSGTF